MKNHKGFSVIYVVLFVLVIGIVAGTGYYVYNSNKKSNNNSVNFESSSQAKNPTQQDGQEDEWQIFPATDYNFQFSYPQNWKVEKLREVTGPVAAYDGNKILAEYTVTPNQISSEYGNSGYAVNFRVVDNTKKITPVEWYTDASKGGMGMGILQAGESESTTPINGLKTYARTSQYQNGSTYYVVDLGNYLVFVNITSFSSSEDQQIALLKSYSNIYSDIVNSIKTN